MKLTPKTRMIRSYTDHTLNGAIRQLRFGPTWANSLHELLEEKSRRERKGITVTQYQLQIP